MVTQAGPELAVPATKSYTTQVAALAVAIDALAPETGTLDAQFDLVPEAAEAMLEIRPDLAKMVTALARTEVVLASGRGLAFGTTLEVALKLEETCLRPVQDCPTPISSTVRLPSSTTNSRPYSSPDRRVRPFRA